MTDDSKFELLVTVTVPQNVLNLLNLQCSADSESDTEEIEIDTQQAAAPDAQLLPITQYKGRWENGNPALPDEFPNPSNDSYNLRSTNPALLLKLVQLVQRATDAQLDVKVTGNKNKNRKMQNVLDAYAKENPNAPKITLESLVRAIRVENYANSQASTVTEYAGQDIHEFKDVKFPALKEFMEGLDIYVKFVTPGYDKGKLSEPLPSSSIKVPAVHPDVQRKNKDAVRQEKALYQKVQTILNNKP